MRATAAHQASIRFLHGDSWLPWLRENIARPHDRLILSVYMISPWWDDQTMGVSLLDMLGKGARHIPLRFLLLSSLHPAMEQKRYNLDAAKRLIDEGWQVRVKKANHEKCWIIGDHLTLIGSHNLSQTSANTDSDCSVVVNSRSAAQELASRFWSRWASASHYVISEDLNHGQSRADRLTPIPGRRLPKTGSDLERRRS